MWTMVVVAMSPAFGHTANIAESLESVATEDFGPDASIEPLDTRVLRRFAWLDVDERDGVTNRPVLQDLTDEIRAVVESQALRLYAGLDPFFEPMDDPGGRKAGIELDPLRGCTSSMIVKHLSCGPLAQSSNTQS